MRARGLGAAALAAIALASSSPAFAALVVSQDPTSNVSCAAGVCTATAADAVLNAKDFRSMLGAGDLKLVSGSAAEDIVIDAKLHWSEPHTLTLDAYRGITFLNELVSEGGGGAALQIDDGGIQGEVDFVLGKGKLTFWDNSSSLSIGGFSYTLVSDLPTLIADIAANPRGGYALARGYDASVDGTYANSPIPGYVPGGLEGLGHAITNLTIAYTSRKPMSVGLFADMGGPLSNLALEGVSVTSQARDGYTGMAAGTNSGTIQNVSVAGSVHAPSRAAYAGGLVGFNQSVVFEASASGTMDGGAYAVAAGLVGLNQGRVYNSTSSMAVTSGYMACGLVGQAGGPDGEVQFSSATGPVSIVKPIKISTTTAAGLVCETDATVNQSFATGAVYAGSIPEGGDGAAYGGGLVASNSGSIVNCYATGAVSAEHSFVLGGLVSWGLTSVSTSYSTGRVSPARPQVTGGLIGYMTPGGVNFDTYWDRITSGIYNPGRGAGNIANDPGITGLTTTQFQSGLPAGFDPSVWAQDPNINNGYPYLIANPPQ